MQDAFLSFLIKKQMLTTEQAEAIILQAAQEGVSIEDILQAEEWLSPLSLAEQRAEYFNFPLAEETATPEEGVIESSAWPEYQKHQVLPWSSAQRKTQVAFYGKKEEAEHWAENRYGQGRYALLCTTRQAALNRFNRVCAEQLTQEACGALKTHDPACSAYGLGGAISTRMEIFSVLGVLLLLLIFFPRWVAIGVFLAVNIFYLATLLAKAMLFAWGMVQFPKLTKRTGVLRRSEKALPIYTVLVPLYREAEVLPRLREALLLLDYPRSKLDIKLIIEADDEVTQVAIAKLTWSSVFEIISVPFSLPRTKPKACNYALPFARGEYVTIYDAEDIPDPLQIRKALWQFHHAGKKVVCVQARLNYFNVRENLLTRLFAIEYATLFDALLPALEKLGIPIPLGGTSNHFRKEALTALYGWDPYNVTEDADLGIRIAQKGWRCVMIDSITKEEATLTLGAWIRQRSRWIKGHMQTYLVHMRRPLELWRTVGTVGFIGFQFFLGAPGVVFLISPILWLIWVLFMLQCFDLPPLLPDWFSNLVSFSIVLFWFGLAIQAAMAIAMLLRWKWYDLWNAGLCFPFYWVLHSLASFKALWQLVTKPYYWEKTTHGVTRVKGSGK